MDRTAFVTVDVFTDTRFGGNPLAVVPDAGGLDGATMQRIAAEFNLSETAFVLPPADPANTSRVRIFTPGAELPFAGHPNVGTAFVLAQQGHVFGQSLGDRLRFEEGAGLVEIDVLREDGAVVGAGVRAPQAPTFGAAGSPAAIAACVSLTAEDVLTTRHPPTTASVGLAFTVVELVSLDALARAVPNAAACAAAAGAAESDPAFSYYLYARIGEDPRRVRARMFAPLAGIPEDPATGSAAGALGALLASLDPGADGLEGIVVEQGVEMGRPSRIDVVAEVVGGQVQSVSIAGRCVPVMRGEIELAGD